MEIAAKHVHRTFFPDIPTPECTPRACGLGFRFAKPEPQKPSPSHGFQAELSPHITIYVTGYSWKTNQYGLTIDMVTVLELVKPDGNVVTVTKASDPNFFFGLKVHAFSAGNM